MELPAPLHQDKCNDPDPIPRFVYITSLGPWPAVGFSYDSSGDRCNPRKRSASHVFGDYSESENDAQDELGYSRASNKRSLERPYACPFFKNNPLINSQCSKWRDVTLSQVKKHILRVHIKPLRCGRCKIFKAGDYDQVTHHLTHDDCKKQEGFDTYEQDTALKKADMIELATTWQGIYAVLFSFNIPSPFWQEEIEALMAPLENNELLFTLRLFAADHCNKRAYQKGLAEYLRSHIANQPEGYMDDLLSEYDQYWITRTSEIEPSLIRESEYSPDVTIRVRFSPIQPRYRTSCTAVGS